MVAIYPAVVSVRNGLAWFGALDGWEQLAVASLLAVPLAISLRSLSALRQIALPIAGVGVLLVGALSVRRSSVSPPEWVRRTSGLKLFAAASVVPAVVALAVSEFSELSISPVDVYTVGLPIVGVALLAIRYQED